MPSPRSFSASSLDDVHDYDLNSLGGCSFDIINEIDKFLETLDGAESDGADLEVVNNNTPNNQSDVEFVGKDSAVFQLLEDHENYGVYEHNPNECNWNVFYKTLPPGEQIIKLEPIKTEIVNDDFSENILETFSFNIDNTQEKSSSLDSSNVISTAADTTDDDVLEKFSFKCSPSKDENINKNEFRKPQKYRKKYRKNPTERNYVKQTFQSHFPPVPFRAHGVVLEGNSSLPSAQSHFPPVPFRAHGVVGKGNSSLPSAQSLLPPVPFRAHGVVGEGNSSLPAAQSHLLPVPFRAPSVVGEYLCPVSLIGKTIKFESKKLANTRIREKIAIELATRGVIENNWWTPDDMLFAKYRERTDAQNVFTVFSSYK